MPLIVDWASTHLRDTSRTSTMETPLGRIAARFHNTLAEMIVEVARLVGEKQVVLTGGLLPERVPDRANRAPPARRRLPPLLAPASPAQRRRHRPWSDRGHGRGNARCHQTSRSGGIINVSCNTRAGAEASAVTIPLHACWAGEVRRHHQRGEPGLRARGESWRLRDRPCRLRDQHAQRGRSQPRV